MVFDYETLKLIWWLFVAVLLIGFALMDGFDLGVGTLLPIIARRDEERRILINSIGPTWEGNQVWLITAGGALFAAWPLVYAAAFSGLYAALIVVLFALILRPVGFDFRSKVEDTRWRTLWDSCLFLGGFVPALIFGVAFGNLLLGVPFSFDGDLRSVYTGGFFELLNPFALLAGVVSVSMLVMHGATFIQLRTEGVLSERARRTTFISGIVFMVTFALAGLWIAFGIEGYRIVSMPDANSSFMPIRKEVVTDTGGWLHNYGVYPLLWLVPLAAFAGTLLALLFSKLQQALLAFLSSSLTVTATLLTTGISMFPFVMPSKTVPNHSLTLWDAVSSHLTLSIMFWAVVIFLPIIIVYTSWVYSVMRGKVTEAHIRENTHSAY